MSDDRYSEFLRLCYAYTQEGPADPATYCLDVGDVPVADLGFKIEPIEPDGADG